MYVYHRVHGFDESLAIKQSAQPCLNKDNQNNYTNSLQRFGSCWCCLFGEMSLIILLFYVIHLFDIHRLRLPVAALVSGSVSLIPSPVRLFHRFHI